MARHLSDLTLPAPHTTPHPTTPIQVEYFGQKLEGFFFTQHGWVQSYGSRYVKPPIIAGDVTRVAPMTVHEFKLAQGMTSRFVKGMLTGPVTIINWCVDERDCAGVWCGREGIFSSLPY